MDPVETQMVGYNGGDVVAMEHEMHVEFKPLIGILEAVQGAIFAL